MASTSIPLPGVPHIVDLFAGPGGLDVGAAWLGVPSIGLELDKGACETRLQAGLETVPEDVRRYGPKDFPECTVLAGGPPCQTFTVAGAGSGRRALSDVIELLSLMSEGAKVADGLAVFDDERTALVLEPMRWVLEAFQLGRPFQAVVLEQVPAVLPIWSAFRAVLENLGYGVDHGVIRTEEYGVPQTRRRAVLIARFGSEVQLPRPTHQAFRKGAALQGSFDLRKWVSMAETLDRDSGFTVVSNYGSGGDPRNRGRRRSDEPSATVTGKVMRNRLELSNGKWDRFAHYEAGMLQTFPRDYPWAGSDIGQQIGNAIPPRLAVHILGATLGIGVDAKRLEEISRSSWRISRHGGVAALPADLSASA